MRQRNTRTHTRLARLALPLISAALLCGAALSGTAAQAATAVPSLHNGTWCGGWLANQGTTSRPCLTFSGGRAWGYVQFGSVSSGCAVTVTLYGPIDQSSGYLPCNNGVGTYPLAGYSGYWEMCDTIYRNGNAITGQCTNWEYGP
jgi:hypothetical protein